MSPALSSNSTTAMIQQDEQQFQTALDRFKAEAEAITVKTAADCLTAKTKQREVRDYMKRVHGALDPFVEDAKSNWQRAKDRLARWLTPAQAVDDILAEKVQAYEREERRLAAEDTARQNAENARKAREKADADAKAAKEKADAERKEQVAHINAALKSGEIGKREAARQLRLAGATAEAAIQQAEADAEAAKATPPPPVIVQPNIPTVAGVPTSRRAWRWEVEDESKIPDEYWILNELKLNAIVRADKERTNIPGIRVFQQP
jgi:hypothetical protein